MQTRTANSCFFANNSKLLNVIEILQFTDSRPDIEIYVTKYIKLFITTYKNHN